MRRRGRRARGWVGEGRGRAGARGLVLGADPRLPGALGRPRTCCPRWSASPGAAMEDVCEVVFFFFGSFVFHGAAGGTPTTTLRTSHLGRSREGRRPRFLSLGFPRAWWLGFLVFCFLTGLHCPLQAVISAKYQ